MAQAATSREQDERHFSEQQALLQKQMADLKLRASKFGSESSQVSDSLRKKRLKLQQDVEVRQGSYTVSKIALSVFWAACGQRLPL